MGHVEQTRIAGRAGRFLEHGTRESMLTALEQELKTTLTEAEVFQAARLFFALMSSAAFVQQDVVQQDIDRQHAQMSAAQAEKIKST